MYLGIDVHKRYAQVAVMDEAGKIVEEVRVENANLDDLAQRYAGAQAVLEATSNYYHIHDTLSEHLDVTVAHPKKINQIADTDKKTDRVDAKELARMLRLNSVPESYVPSEEVREARALVRGRQTLVENRTKYANKVHGLLSDHGITEDVKPLSVEGREFLRELSIPTPWDELLDSYLDLIESLTEEIQKLEETIEQRAGSLKETQLLMSIPGVSYFTALTIYAEVGDIRRFDRDKEVVSYVGLNPVIRESGDSRIEGSISKRGSGRVRWLLVQAANTAVHTCNDEYLSRFYDRLASRKNSQKAIVATARKVLVSIYHMLDRGEVYDPPGVSA
ncbi:IS110 family transposase [Halorubrum ezzemoulense DSM 17463]|uniref:IS110 family transposase n=2 Tax=Halorubrum ezzemoulense TaxID=337243 RepID=A0A1X4G9Y8_HALEZ|nr:IS110 family transposase [Halorubrum ezzemoulense]OSO93936.1 IS110 family transposase [Halorubrum ezzemoulense DSM 17463]